MRPLAALLTLLPTLAQADVLICEFTPQDCPANTHCEPFELTIDTHHGPDAPYFDYGGVFAPIRLVPDDSAEAPSYVTLGHGDREIITLFNGFDAIHTRHYTRNDQPVALTSLGRCVSFY